MSKYIFILGKDEALSEAELRAVFPSAKLDRVAECAILDLDRELGKADFDRLGGSVKMAELTTEMVKGGLKDVVADTLSELHGGSKLDYGISVYGMPEKSLHPLLIGLKTEMKARGLSARFANQGFLNISSAQYKGLSKKGVELVVVKTEKGFIIGKVVAVQDIDSYSKRDFKKPFRDMRVGMLPPKLAQIMVNLTRAPEGGTIWDPFCGGGVLLMEGLLMGYEMAGSDINEDTLAGAQENIEWLAREFGTPEEAELFAHDAMESLDADELKRVDAIAFEGYLGPPQSRPRPAAALGSLVHELDKLYVTFFRQLKRAGFAGPVVVGLPFFRSSEGREVTLVSVIRQIERMGWKASGPIKYARADQVVGREIWRFEA